MGQPRLEFHRVGVFTQTPLGGNPLVVFPDAAGLTSDEMQSIARELNLSETTFVFPPDDPANDFRVRIFSVNEEMPMAGHPTVGTAFVLHRLGRITATSLQFEQKVGVIPVHFHPDTRIEMIQPNAIFSRVWTDPAPIAEILSIPPDSIRTDLPMQVVLAGVGKPYLYVPLRDLATIQSIQYRRDVWERVLKDYEAVKILAFTTETLNPTSHIHARMFSPYLSRYEDAATGAANGPLGAYLVKYGVIPPDQAPHIISEQGFEMHRPSLLHIHIGLEGQTIMQVSISGTCVYLGNGFLEG